MEVQEGRTRLWVPRDDHAKGPKRRQGVPFYNPAMRTSRDLSVLTMSALVEASQRPWRVCDAMTATGARGLRFANEVPGVQVQLNDANPDSIQLAQQNAKQLGLGNVDFRVGRLEPHLGAERYDWVDIDPFGTPAPFLDVSMLAVEDQGILAVTATDTATLSGVYVEACRRRYNATPRRRSCMPEIATRILVGAMVRSAGRRDRAATPVLAYSTQHYVRAYCRVEDGAQKADACQRQLKYACFDADGNRSLADSPSAPESFAGPLWGGPLFDVAVLDGIHREAALRKDLAVTTHRLIARFREESNAPPLYYDVEEITQSRPLETPPIEEWIAALRAEGYVATRTHFSARGIKTNARFEEILAAGERFRAAPPRRP